MEERETEITAPEGAEAAGSLPVVDDQPTPSTPDSRVAIVVAIAIVMILVGVVSVLVARTPDPAATATGPEVDACFANQRSMEGAALVYLNRTGEVAPGVTALGAAYEANPPSCPSGGTYEFLTSGPYVTCSTHGSFMSPDDCGT